MKVTDDLLTSHAEGAVGLPCLQSLKLSASATDLSLQALTAPTYAEGAGAWLVECGFIHDVRGD